MLVDRRSAAAFVGPLAGTQPVRRILGELWVFAELLRGVVLGAGVDLFSRRLLQRPSKQLLGFELADTLGVHGPELVEGFSDPTPILFGSILN